MGKDKLLLRTIVKSYKPYSTTRASISFIKIKVFIFCILLTTEKKNMIFLFWELAYFIKQNDFQKKDPFGCKAQDFIIFFSG